MGVQYYHLCKDCAYIRHCFDREDAERIENDEMTDEDYLRPDKCYTYYPDVDKEVFVDGC
jgi:hypothetical protein